MKAEGKHWKMEGESIIVVSSPHLSRAPHPTAPQHNSTTATAAWATAAGDCLLMPLPAPSGVVSCLLPPAQPLI